MKFANKKSLESTDYQKNQQDAGLSRRERHAAIMELMQSLLCDKCLALAERNEETPISEFCARCHRKLATDFLKLTAMHFSQTDDEDE
jgi:hypothetical protein